MIVPERRDVRRSPQRVPRTGGRRPDTGRARSGSTSSWTQLAEAVGGREPLTRFATARKAEVDAGSTGGATAPEPGLTEQDANALLAGFIRIRDDEHLDDVADWANAVVALLEDSFPGPARGRL